MAVTQAQLNSLNKPYAGEVRKTPSKKLDKDAFMELFVAQLKNQDPLNPLSNKDSTAQMAQFAQLEQMTNMTNMLKGIASALQVNQTLQASSLIGKSVLANGNSISKSADGVSKINLDIPKGVTSVKVNIHDSAGNIIRTVDLKGVKEGKNDFLWDGKNASGGSASNGVYKISVVAENDQGKKFLVPTQVEGKVQSVEVKNGQQVLTLSDNRQVLLSNVWKINAQQA